MKKRIFTVCLILLLSAQLYILRSNKVYGQEYNFNLTIEPSAIQDPSHLSTWAPTTESPELNDSLNWTVLGPVTGLGIPSLIYSGIKGIMAAKQQQKIIYNKPIEFNDSNLNSTEEIIYEISLKNSDKTPLDSDTMLYIKIPDWLIYSENSFILNNSRLTDIEDDDRFNNMDNSILSIDLRKLNKDKIISIVFGAKAKENSKESKEDDIFCLVRFVSKTQKTDSGWKRLSSDI